MSQPSYEVLVVGGGGAGLAAALASREAGASRVCVVEAAGELGGTTARSAGSFMAAGTDVQNAAGYPGDTPDDMIQYFQAVSQWDLDFALVSRLAHASAPTLRWLQGHGVEFLPSALYRAGLERWPRSHRATGLGSGIIDALSVACASAGVELLCSMPVNEVTSQAAAAGHITGVRAGDVHISANAVVLATGGFASNSEMVARYEPGFEVTTPLGWSPAATTCRGDGINWAIALGAATASGSSVTRVNPLFPVADLYLPPWLMLVDRSGRRFIDESAPPQAIGPALQKRGGAGWAIFDDRFRHSEYDTSLQAGSEDGWATVLKRHTDSGDIVSAISVQALADGIGMDPTLLARSIERYNQAALQGDSAFGKAERHVRPVDQPPFYAMALEANVPLITGYGLRVDPDARVLDRADQPIPRLYAAGEIVGNALGARYPGQGSAIAAAITVGRIAGTSAARRVAS